jgi:hypothetical protein
MEEEMTIFEVDTAYKSGRKRTDMICAKTEDEMWLIYDKHHDKDKIEWCGICDSWPA